MKSTKWIGVVALLMALLMALLLSQSFGDEIQSKLTGQFLFFDKFF